jgi:SAM-dependent methyltransferase
MNDERRGGIGTAVLAPTVSTQPSGRMASAEVVRDEPAREFSAEADVDGDEIAIDEDLAPAALPPAAPKAQSEVRPSAPPAAPPDPAAVKRTRPRMALRIPDDEVARPRSDAPGSARSHAAYDEGSATDALPREGRLGAPPRPADFGLDDEESPPTPHDPAYDASGPAVTATRIITINPPSSPSLGDDIPSGPRVPSAIAPPGALVADDEDEDEDEEATRRRLSLPDSARVSMPDEDSWTPYQPTAMDAKTPFAPPVFPSEERAPSSAERALRRSGAQPTARAASAPDEALSADEVRVELASDPPDSGEPLDLDEALAANADVPTSRPPPDDAGERRAKVPPPARVPAELAPVRAPAPTEPEGEDVRFDEDDEAARASSPAPELEPEDVVSVEPAPIVTAPRAVPSVQPKPATSTPPAKPPASRAVPTPLPVAAPTASNPARATSLPPPSRPQPRAPAPIAPPTALDGSAQRRRARPWWEELFNDDFIRSMAKLSDAQIAREADFIEESLGVQKGAMLLDLACGTGRHAVELSRRGYNVVGFDLSLPMLARAADEAQERSTKLNFLQGDMREMTFEDTFDGIFCWNTSFGFFDEEKNSQVLARVHRALKKGGQFLLDVANRDYIVQRQPSLVWFEGDGCICMDEMQVDFVTSRMKVKRTMMMDDGRTKEIEYSIRLYALHELGKMLNDHGFRVAEVSGRPTTPGVFFGAESPQTLILAEKR